MSFRELSVFKFSEYKYKYQVLSNGKKIKFDDFSMLFDTEEQALRHILKIHTSATDFDFFIEK